VLGVGSQNADDWLIGPCLYHSGSDSGGGDDLIEEILLKICRDPPLFDVALCQLRDFGPQIMPDAGV